MQDGNTPLHLASCNEHLDVVRYLIEKCGADVNVTNDVSKFPSFLSHFLFTCFRCLVSHCNTIFVLISVLTSKVWLL
jgi:ankyrin repeat protein